jgi:hypothetical protein
MLLRPQIYCCIIGTSTGRFTRISRIYIGISSADNKEPMMEIRLESQKTANDILSGF